MERMCMNWLSYQNARIVFVQNSLDKETLATIGQFVVKDANGTALQDDDTVVISRIHR